MASESKSDRSSIAAEERVAKLLVDGKNDEALALCETTELEVRARKRVGLPNHDRAVCWCGAVTCFGGLSVVASLQLGSTGASNLAAVQIALLLLAGDLYAVAPYVRLLQCCLSGA